jgi:hypothetical protein
MRGGFISTSKPARTNRAKKAGNLRPYILINHLSPNKNINNFYYLEPINTRRMREMMLKFAETLK